MVLLIHMYSLCLKLLFVLLFWIHNICYVSRHNIYHYSTEVHHRWLQIGLYRRFWTRYLTFGTDGSTVKVY